MDEILVVEQRGVAFSANVASWTVFAGTRSAAGSHAVVTEVLRLECDDSLLHWHFLQFTAFLASVTGPAISARWGDFVLFLLRRFDEPLRESLALVAALLRSCRNGGHVSFLLLGLAVREFLLQDPNP